MALATISMCQAASKTQYVMANHRAQRYRPGKLLRLVMESPGTALTQHLQPHLMLSNFSPLTYTTPLLYLNQHGSLCSFQPML